MSATTTPEDVGWWVPPEAGGARLDAWLTAQLPDLSRSKVGQAIAEGRVRVDGAVPKKAGQRLAGGERVTFTPAPPPPAAPEPEDLPLRVVHLDERLAVIDKPAGLVVHPGAGRWSGTLVNALIHHLGERGLSTVGGGDRPGIVHRIDRDTSGLLVVARDDQAHRALAAQFEAHTAERRYLAVVLGPRIADGGILESAGTYGRHPRDRRKMTGRLTRGGRRACTHFATLARSQTQALVVCELETGRTHQIRVHLAEAGYPVVADPVYGRPAPKGGGGRLAVEHAAARRMPRQALHAASLGFVHPGTGARLFLVAPPPADFATLVTEVFGAAALDVALRALEAPWPPPALG